VGDRVQCPEEYVEEAVPVDRGGDVPLTSACDGLEARRFLSVISAEAFDAFGLENGASVWGADDGEAAVVEVDEVVSQERRDTDSPPCHAEHRFGDAVEGFSDVPRGPI
jgi:hypothetical protein